MLVLFVDIGRIVDYHCLNFLVMVHESLAMHQFMHTQIFSLLILKLNCIFLYNSCFDNPGYKSEFISLQDDSNGLHNYILPIRVFKHVGFKKDDTGL